MQLRCDAFLQFCPFRLKQHLYAPSNKAVITLCFAVVELCDVYFRYWFVHVLVFCRFLPRWFCRDSVGLRGRGMEDLSCFLLLW